MRRWIRVAVKNRKIWSIGQQCLAAIAQHLDKRWALVHCPGHVAFIRACPTSEPPFHDLPAGSTCQLKRELAVFFDDCGLYAGTSLIDLFFVFVVEAVVPPGNAE